QLDRAGPAPAEHAVDRVVEELHVHGVVEHVDAADVRLAACEDVVMDRPVRLRPHPLVARIEHEIVAELAADAASRPGASVNDVVLDGDGRRALELEVVALAPATEVAMVAVVAPNLH